MITLGINIDHVASLREARKGIEPDPLWAAALCELAGCDCITVHLREDRRHINDNDLNRLRKSVQSKLNLEMAAEKKIIAIAKKIKPEQATLVPEKREEVTTEGGLDVVKNFRKIKATVSALKKSNIAVSLFIDPLEKQIKASKETGAQFIELHTGAFANAKKEKESRKELTKLIEGARFAHELNLRINAGHGINYLNIKEILKIPYLEELNIGHSIISRAIFVGLPQAVKEMLTLIRDYSLLLSK